MPAFVALYAHTPQSQEAMTAGALFVVWFCIAAGIFLRAAKFVGIVVLCIVVWVAGLALFNTRKKRFW